MEPAGKAVSQQIHGERQRQNPIIIQVRSPQQQSHTTSFAPLRGDVFALSRNAAQSGNTEVQHGKARILRPRRVTAQEVVKDARRNRRNTSAA